MDILNGYDKESFKAYYNGNTKISSLARKISPYVEPFGFSEYIGSFQDCAIQGLCETFQKYIPDIDLHNAADKLADLFASIIREAAAATRKPTGKSVRTDSDAEFIEAEVVDDEMPSGAAGQGEGGEIVMRLLWRLSREAVRYRNLYIVAILSTLGLTAVNLAAPRALSAMTGIVERGVDAAAFRAIGWLTVALVALYLLRVVFRGSNDAVGYFSCKKRGRLFVARVRKSYPVAVGGHSVGASCPRESPQQKHCCPY